ncbi:glycosyltransferase [Thiocapsa marina]|uniref:Glycosyl transferase family 2 n=1 Tax=Thiocapsa marina 5811 TaxID=768671 RepID=F9U968_9GAMM|nr:glycosyltransferase family 2 protein [Thiocapsa marina]EGV19326.1 glycosyl transferase family 2 [Thiocapsa marina 5811]
MAKLTALAILATYNEQRFVRACIENLARQGFETYLLDNESTDGTVEIARQYLGRGLIAIESLPRDGFYRWERILQRKVEIAQTSGHDWFMHVDADEIRLPPPPFRTIHEALGEVDSQGYNAVNFAELCFVPTREEPDHDHPQFQDTMRRYYAIRPFPHNRLNLWKRQASSPDLASSGGHQIGFPELKVYPTDFLMRHYLFLSTAHAKEKWIDRHYDPEELERGWHRSRARLQASAIRLQSSNELRLYRSDQELDASEPLQAHPVFSLR